jgi:hypothetical protein
MGRGTWHGALLSTIMRGDNGTKESLCGTGWQSRSANCGKRRRRNVKVENWFYCKVPFQLRNIISLSSRKCHSLVDAGATRSRRVCSSPSWWSVSALIHHLLNSGPMRCCMFVLLGASGTGRTTFVNTLCESEVLAHKISDNPETAHVEEGIRIKPANVGALLLSARALTVYSIVLCCRVGRGWCSYCAYHCGYSGFW